MKFSKQLIAVRAKLNITQSQLAEMLGVSLITINRWENELAKPTKVSVYRFEELCKEKGIEMGGEYNG